MALRTARRRALHTFADLAGGINLEGADYLVEGSQARDLLNVEPEGNGFRRRRSNRSVADTTIWTDGIYTYMAAMPSDASLVVIGQDESSVVGFREVNPVTGAVTNRAGAFSFTADLQYCLFVAPVSGSQGPLYGTALAGSPFYFTGSANVAAWTASAGTLPTAKFGLYHANRVWLANVNVGGTGHTNSVYWSSLNASGGGDPRNWSQTAPNDAGFVDVGNPSDVITGIGTVGPYLLVFMANATWLIYDTNTGANRQISDRIGTVAHRSITPTPYGTFFIAQEGVFVTDGSSIKEISQAIKPLFDTRGQGYQSAAIFHEDSLLVTIRDSALDDHLMQYHIPSKTWWEHTPGGSEIHGGMASFARLDSDIYGQSSFNSELGADRIFQLFDPDAANDSAAASWTSPWHALGNPVVDKRIHELRLDADGAITVEVQRYPTDSFTTQTAVNWEALGAAVTERRFYTPGMARLLSVRLSSTAADFRVGSYQVDATQRVS